MCPWKPLSRYNRAQNNGHNRQQTSTPWAGLQQTAELHHIYVNEYSAWTRQSYNSAYTTFSCLTRNNYWPASACGRTATCCSVFMVFAATKGNQSFNMMDDSRRQSGKAFCVSSYNVEESVMYELQLHCLPRESLICLVSNGRSA
jgi:hypothetical protein